MHSPERILESLAWLYGVEFRNGEDPQYWATDISVHVWFRESDRHWLRDQDHWHEDITAEVEHALAVTAPWEWKDGGEDVVFAFRGDDVMGHVQDNKARGASWRVSTDDGVTHSGSTPGVETAQSAARAAYLTWMRGCLALRGIEKEGGAKHVG